MSDMNAASLTYLTNPLYQQILKQQKEKTSKNSKSDIKFYRKRIMSLTKDMLKGDIPNNTYVKSVYDSYMSGLISYFKMIDTRDIIQNQYASSDDNNLKVAEDSLCADTLYADTLCADTLCADTLFADTLFADSVYSCTKTVTVQDMNDRLMRKCAGIATLDNFVIKQHNETTETRIIPVIIAVDLKEPSLKKKGVKNKGKKVPLKTIVEEPVYAEPVDEHEHEPVAEHDEHEPVAEHEHEPVAEHEHEPVAEPVL